MEKEKRTYAISKLPYDQFVLLLLCIQIRPSINELQVIPWILRTRYDGIVKTVDRRDWKRGNEWILMNKKNTQVQLGNQSGVGPQPYTQYSLLYAIQKVNKRFGICI